MLGGISCPDHSARTQARIDRRPLRARLIADAASWCGTGTDLCLSLPARTLDCRHTHSRINCSRIDHCDLSACAPAARNEMDLKRSLLYWPKAAEPGWPQFGCYRNYRDPALNSQPFSLAITGCVVSHASQILQPGCDNTTRRANHPKPVQPSREKYFCFSEMKIRLLMWPSHPARGALRTSRTRGGMRWTRMLRRTSAADAYGKSVWF